MNNNECCGGTCQTDNAAIVDTLKRHNFAIGLLNEVSESMDHSLLKLTAVTAKLLKSVELISEDLSFLASTKINEGHMTVDEQARLLKIAERYPRFSSDEQPDNSDTEGRI